MKKLNRLNIDALKKANPVLGIIEQKIVTGGAGPGDGIYRCIGMLKGINQDSVRDIYAQYLMINSMGDSGCGCGVGSTDMGYWQSYADTYGVQTDDIGWLMHQYDFNEIASPIVGSIIVFQNASGGVYDAAVITSIAGDGYWLKYNDAQSGGEGYLYHKVGNTYTDCGGDLEINIIATYKL